MYVCMYVCMDGWMGVCTYVCMYVCQDGWKDGRNERRSEFDPRRVSHYNHCNTRLRHALLAHFNYNFSLANIYPTSRHNEYGCKVTVKSNSHPRSQITSRVYVNSKFCKCQTNTTVIMHVHKACFNILIKIVTYLLFFFFFFFFFFARRCTSKEN